MASKVLVVVVLVVEDMIWTQICNFQSDNDGVVLLLLLEDDGTTASVVEDGKDNNETRDFRKHGT